MEGRHVVITEDSPYSCFGYYRGGDTGVLVGFTQGYAIVVLDNDGKFVKVEINNLIGLCND